VTKLTSTTTGVDVGFRRERSSPFEAAVDPTGKYHVADVVDTHGATDQPVVPCTSWLTPTPPPAIVTMSATHDPEVGAGNAGVTWSRAGTATADRTEVPASVTCVIVPVTARVVVLLNRRLPTATPDAVDWPAQYHAEDSAFGALTIAPGTGCAPTGVGLRVATTTATAAMTTTTTARTRQRRSEL
jgi:hypothetical protein